MRGTIGRGAKREWGRTVFPGVLVAGGAGALGMLWWVGAGHPGPTRPGLGDLLLSIAPDAGSAAFLAVAVGLLVLAWTLGHRRGRARPGPVSGQGAGAGDRRPFDESATASLAHDFNNVLAVMRAGTEELRALDLPPEAGDVLGHMEVSLSRGTALTRRLTTMGRDETLRDRPLINLTEGVRRSVALVSRHPRVRACRLRFVPSEHLLARIDPSGLDRIVANLVINAADAVAGHGDIEVRLHRGAGRVIIEVHDDGPGIAADHLESVFAPFFSTRSDGTGLGLPSVKASAEAASGGVEVDRSPLGGACVRVWLPPPHSVAEPRPPGAPPGAGHVVEPGARPHADDPDRTPNRTAGRRRRADCEPDPRRAC